MTTGKEKRERKQRVEALDSALRRLGWNIVLAHGLEAEKLELNARDTRALSYLSEMGPMRAGRLAQLIGVTTGAVTGIVDHLERAGLVRRESDPADRRKVRIVPLLERSVPPRGLFPPGPAELRELFDDYSDQELEVILDFVDRASDRIRRRIDPRQSPR